MSLRAGPWIALLVVATALAGCLGADPAPKDDAPPTETGLTSVFDRHLLPFNVSAPYSRVLTPGPYEILEALSIDLPVSLPADEGGAAATGDARIHMGLFLPDVPAGTKVPVVADIGPYYDELDTAATEPANRLGRFLIENLVPHGYAVAQVSVFGTGAANHCMDLMGRSEQLGVDAAVTYLGTQPWSNGKVGLIGRSYDGSTPWQAAMFGNEHLATIVPISGLIGMHELMWRNGTAEFRGPIMHNLVYGFYGVDSAGIAPFALFNQDPSSAVRPRQADTEDVTNLCRDYLAGPVQGAAAFATGDHAAPQANDYWAERYFLDRALANHKGSVYFIHGMQDWNVDPHMAFPAYQRLQDAGIEVKGLFGQWNHMYPDRPSEHSTTPSGEGREAFPHSVRLDWAQDLLEWFDHYLKGTGPKPPLHVEIQDNQGAWRIEETYPPKDISWTPLSFGTDLKQTSMGEPRVGPSADPVLVRRPVENPTEAPVRFEFAGFADEQRLVGTPRLHLTVTPTGAGGQLFVQLRDKTADLRLGHAVIDLRYAAGDGEMRPVTPGLPLLARMEFEALDVVVPAGHVLELVITPTGEDYLPTATPGSVLIDATDKSVLKLSTVERAETAFFTPVRWDVCTHPNMVARAEGNEAFATRLQEDHGCPA